MATVTNTRTITLNAGNYTITSIPAFNMYEFFRDTNRTNHDVNSSQYTPAN